MRIFALVWIALLAFAISAQAACVTKLVTSASTTVIAANDLPGPGRHYLEVCNNGPSETVWCSVGASQSSTVAVGQMLPLGACAPPLKAVNVGSGNVGWVPADELSCNTSANQAYVRACDY